MTTLTQEAVVVLSTMLDSLSEMWLEQKGIAFERVVNFDLSNAPSNESMRPNPRKGLTSNFDPLMVSSYKEAMLNGSIFPAPLLYIDPDSGLYGCIGGHHRICAARSAGFTHLSWCTVAYPTSQAQVDLLRRTHNAIGGRYSNEDGIMQAMELIRRHGFSIKDAAVEGKVAEATLRARYRAWEVERELRDEQYEVTGATQSDFIAVAPIPRNRHRAQVLHLTFQGKLSNEKRDELIAQVRKCRSDAEADMLLADRAQSLEVKTTKTRRSRTRFESLAITMAAITAQCAKIDDVDAQLLGAEEKKRLETLRNNAAIALRDISKKLL